MTTCVPAKASLRPWPVMVLMPVLGEAATTSWPPWRRMGAVFEPIRPVPPITTIFMVRLRLKVRDVGRCCVLLIGPSTDSFVTASNGQRDTQAPRSGRRSGVNGVRWPFVRQQRRKLHVRGQALEKRFAGDVMLASP